MGGVWAGVGVRSMIWGCWSVVEDAPLPHPLWTERHNYENSTVSRTTRVVGNEYYPQWWVYYLSNFRVSNQYDVVWSVTVAEWIKLPDCECLPNKWTVNYALDWNHFKMTVSLPTFKAYLNKFVVTSARGPHYFCQKVVNWDTSVITSCTASEQDQSATSIFRYLWALIKFTLLIFKLNMGEILLSVLELHSNFLFFISPNSKAEIFFHF